MAVSGFCWKVMGAAPGFLPSEISQTLVKKSSLVLGWQRNELKHVTFCHALTRLHEFVDNYPPNIESPTPTSQVRIVLVSLHERLMCFGRVPKDLHEFIQNHLSDSLDALIHNNNQVMRNIRNCPQCDLLLDADSQPPDVDEHALHDCPAKLAIEQNKQVGRGSCNMLQQSCPRWLKWNTATMEDK